MSEILPLASTPIRTRRGIIVALTGKRWDTWSKYARRHGTSPYNVALILQATPLDK